VGELSLWWNVPEDPGLSLS